MIYFKIVWLLLSTVSLSTLIILWFNVDRIGDLLKEKLVVKNETLDYFLNCPVCQSVWVTIIVSTVLHYSQSHGAFYIETTCIAMLVVRLCVNSLAL